MLVVALALLILHAAPACAQDAPPPEAQPAVEAPQPAAEGAQPAVDGEQPAAEGAQPAVATHQGPPPEGGPQGPPPGDEEAQGEAEPRKGVAGLLQRLDLFQGFTISGSNTLTFQDNQVEGSQAAYETQRWDTGSVVRQSSLHLEGPVWNRLSFQADISDSGWGQSYTRWVAGYVGDNTALLYGDLDLGIGGNEFAGFNKSTRGWQLDQRLPGGGFMRGFYIQEKGVVRNQTFVGNDTPGPYFLTFTPVIEGSEVVKVNEDPMRFGSDYRLDYDSGQLYFEPIDGQARIITAADTISVSYQSLGYNDGGPGEIYGARAEMPLLNDKLLLGLTMLRHDRLENSSSSDTVGFQEDIYNGSGSTGPFDTNFRPIIADGTSVVYKGERKIIDRALVVLVDGVEQIEAVDYDAYRSIGRVEFRRVVPPTALVKVQYYYEITGDDDSDLMGDQDIWGLDLAWRLSDDLNVSMDLAQSKTAGTDESGSAMSASVDWTIGKIHTLAEFRNVDSTYNYLDTVGFQRREKGLNLGLEWAITPGISLYDRYSDMQSDTGNSFGYSGYSGSSLYDSTTYSSSGKARTAATSDALDIGTRRHDLGLDLRFDGWPSMKLQRSTMSNRGGSSGNSDYTNDTLSMDYSPEGAKYTVRANLNRTRQQNVTVTETDETLAGSESRQFQTSVTYRPMTGLSLAASMTTNRSSALETVNDSSSRNLQLSANWMPSSALTVELSRSLSRTDGRVSSSYYGSTLSTGTRYAPSWLASDLNPGGGDGGGDDDDEQTTTRPSSEDVTDNLSVTWSPGSGISLDMSLGKRKYNSQGGQGYLANSTQDFWNVGATWQMSDALSLNLGLGNDTMEYLDEERGTITNRSLIAGATYRPPGARWNTSLNLNVQDGSSPTYVGYGRLQKYRSVSTHLFDVGGQLSYDISDNLTLYASAGVSDYDGGYSAFKKTSGELRARYQFSQTIGLDLGFRSIKNVAGQTMDDLVYGTTGQGQDYIANTFLLSLSMSFQGGLGGPGGTGGPSYTGGPGTFGGYQPGLRTGTGRYGGSTFGSGFGSGSTGTGYGTGRFDTIGQRRTTTTTGPFGAPSWETTGTIPSSTGGGLSEGLGGFRKDDNSRGEGRRTPGTIPGESDGQDVPEDWWLLDDNAGGW